MAGRGPVPASRLTRSVDAPDLTLIFGSSRSGSTWLLRMLRRHPDVLGIDETGLDGFSARPPSGSSTSSAIVQRSRLKVTGGIQPAAMRPTMALPAHNSGAAVSSRTVVRSRRWAEAFMPAL